MSEELPDLWARALATLPPESQTGLTSLVQRDGETVSLSETITRLISLAQAKQSSYESKRWKFKLKSREVTLHEQMNKIIVSLNKFKEVGDTVVQFDPVHAALPWAAVRFLLLSVTAHHDQAEAITVIVEQAARLAHHGRVLEYVYTEATMKAPHGSEALDALRDDLTKLYSLILKSLEHCCSKLDKSSTRRIIGAVFKPQETKRYVEGLETLWAEVETQAQACDRLCTHEMSGKLKSHFEQLSSSLGRLQSDMSHVLVAIERQQRFELLEFISNIRFASHHIFVHEQRTPGTGEWLLKYNKFLEWEQATSSTITLLYGLPGTGKTFLISRVIDHIKELLEISRQNEGLAYFYCNRDEESRRQPLSVLCSLLRQLASPFNRPGDIHHKLQNLKQDLSLEGRTIDLQMAKKLLSTLVVSYPHTTIILDALDECEPESRHQLMNYLSELMKQTRGLHILISSRPDPDIRRHFISQPMVEIQARNSYGDIAAFVNEKLPSDSRWVELSSELQEEITTTLLTKSNGMFQWTALQIQQLVNLRRWSPPIIKERLGKLPKTLEDAYGEIWSQMDQLSELERVYATRALQWVLCAVRPLKTEELADAMRLDPETDDTNLADEEFSEEVINDLCCNLLTLDREQHVWRYCHLSAVEYVEKNHFSMLQSHRHVAESLLKHFSIDEEDTGSRPDRNWDRHLRVYAFRNWALHVKTQEGLDDLETERLRMYLKRFLGSPRESSPFYRGWFKAWRDFAITIDGRSGQEIIVLHRLSPESSPLPLMCSFGLYKLLLEWWQEPDLDLDILLDEQFFGIYSTMLSRAISYNREPLWRFLIGRGASLYKGSPMTTAIQFEDEAAMLALIDAGLGTGNVDRYVLEALEVCWDTANTRPLSILLQQGPDLNKIRIKDRIIDGTPLSYAMARGLDVAIPILIRHGAQLTALETVLYGATVENISDRLKVYVETSANSILHARPWDLRIVERLLQANVDLGIVIKQFEDAALPAAVRYHFPKLVEVLLKAGANPNALYNGETSFMHLVSRRDERIDSKTRDSIVQMLLEAGADINMVSHSELMPTALHSAVEQVNPEMVEYLLSIGANPNLGSSQQSPLVEVLNLLRLNKDTDKALQIAQLLEAAGADPNHDDGISNPMCIIARTYFNVKLLENLIRRGANPALTFREGEGSALACAAFAGRVEICQFLLRPKFDIDLNARLPGRYENVLFAAMYGIRDCLRAQWAEKDYLEIIRLFLQAGSEIPMPIYASLASPICPISLRGENGLHLDKMKSFRGQDRAVYPLALTQAWVNIIWELQSGPAPMLPLAVGLHECGLPRALPGSFYVLAIFRKAGKSRKPVYGMVWVHGGKSGFLMMKQHRRKKRLLRNPPMNQRTGVTEVSLQSTLSLTREALRQGVAILVTMIALLGVWLMSTRTRTFLSAGYTFQPLS